MSAIVPYPLLAAGLVLMWLLLGGFTPGHLVLSIIIGIACTHGLAALGEKSLKVRRWLLIPKLLGIVLYDIVRSNIAVARIILSGPKRARTSGFITIPLKVRHPSALAILSIILTSTPGTAWLDYNSARGELLIHVFDLVHPDEWIELIGKRYERLLLEIFE
ncbi:Na+/H+ antiporter subunit E [Aliihoeflea sp. PC F10.4]